MDAKLRTALSRGHVIDITTNGRSSGEPRRLEIVFHNLGGRIYISGQPRPQERAWLSNIKANPHFTFHLKGETSGDLPATARVIADEKERREVLTQIARIWKRDDVDRMVRESPLIEVTLDDTDG